MTGSVAGIRRRRTVAGRRETPHLPLDRDFYGQTLNRRIKNREIKVKLDGDGAKLSGIEIEKVDIRYTRDVLNQIKKSGYVWNEKTIRDRTKKLTEEFLKIW